MSEELTYGLIAAYVVVAALLIIDELRHRYFQPAWACSQCGHGPLSATGPAAAFDGRKGFQCPKCGHVMQAYRSKLVLGTICAMSLAITGGCAVILALNWNPDELGLTAARKPVYWLMYVGLVAGPIGAAASVWLMFQPMPSRMRT